MACGGFWPWQGHRLDRPAWSVGLRRGDDGLAGHPEWRRWQARCSKCQEVVALDGPFEGSPPDPVIAAIVLWRDMGRLPSAERVNGDVRLSSGRFIFEPVSGAANSQDQHSEGQK